jgi:tetratricopeptide (TPR) repeat protein
VAADDNERNVSSRARAPSKGDASTRGRWLAAIPVGVACLFFVLMMPRGTTPEDVPLPYVDTRALSKVEQADRARAVAAREKRLPSDILAVGSGIRALNRAQVANDEDAAQAARLELDAALRALFVSGPRANVEEDLASLRAVQIQGFLDEIARFEQTGEESAELRELGGGFLRRARRVGWASDKKVVMDEHALRVAFKLVWNSVTVGDGAGPLAITLDEQRALFAFYLSYPHPGEAVLAGIEAELRDAKSEAACARARANASRETELWRVEKIRRLGALDPSYPTKYALGVAYSRAGRHDQAIDAFRAFVEAHPDGPLALRARNHLKAAVTAYGTY